MTSTQQDRLSVPTPVRKFTGPTTTVQLTAADAWRYVEINAGAHPITAILPVNGGPYTIVDGGNQAQTYPITIKDASGTTVGTIDSNDGSAAFGWDGTRMVPLSAPPRHPPTSAVMSGAVMMQRAVGSVAWTVYAPDGSIIDISASTTEGLQEAITYACTYQFSLFVMGGGSKYSAQNVPPYSNSNILCTTTVNVPPMTGHSIRIQGVTLLFTGMGANNGLVFNSADFATFHHDGQIAYNGTGSAVLFAPANANAEAFTGITSSRFEFGPIACVDGAGAPTGAAGVAVQLNPTGGLIINSTFQLAELNGGLIGLQLDEPVGNSIQRNTFICPSVHTQGSASVKVGTASTTAIHGNFFDLQINASGILGLDVWGQKDNYRVSINDGSTGIQLESSADQNAFFIVNNLATTPVNDLSTTKNNPGVNGFIFPACVGDLGGTDQTAVVTATWTLVQFTHASLNNGAILDVASNKGRITPGRLGLLDVRARVGWTTMADAVSLSVAIYKNGTIYQQVAQSSSGTAGGGGQGPTIAALVPVTALTDYFEIFVEQSSGSNKDINGNATATWLSARMVMS